jgi:hypothetical protein
VWGYLGGVLATRPGWLVEQVQPGRALVLRIMQRRMMPGIKERAERLARG